MIGLLIVANDFLKKNIEANSTVNFTLTKPYNKPVATGIFLHEKFKIMNLVSTINTSSNYL